MNRAAQGRVFNVFCNGKTILADLNLLEQAGENRLLVRTITGLEPNAQGKLLLEFVPVTPYAAVSAIEVEPDVRGDFSLYRGRGQAIDHNPKSGLNFAASDARTDGSAEPESPPRLHFASAPTTEQEKR
jgi:hypothetical protein